MKRRGEAGLFAGVREVADFALGVGNYASATAALNLTKHGCAEEAATLVPMLFKVMNQNWNTAIQTGHRSHSLKNFRWHLPQTKLADHNRSPEVTLERAFMRALVEAGRNDWSNQVPLISGIAGSHAFKKRAVDLVHRHEDGSFEFVELKVNSDTPIYAAVEILASPPQNKGHTAMLAAAD
jgi:hypothetical protein